MRQFLLRLRKARRLGWRDWLRVAYGQVALFQARRDLRTRPHGEMVKRDRGDTPASSDPQQLPAARAIALGVSRAATYGLFGPTCLVQSLAIQRRLVAEGLAAGSIRVGVARRRGTFVAHAWVEFAGEVIGDDRASVERYEPFDELQVMPSFE